ncbi:Maintenance of telomere capping protein 1 [Wickerhamiella sorbophila]|uniref:Maintenance of telomere capping protein 1 n=1 Tax=Wickerhamiella sorbophila TaxID=45607 RepID=A0A2T0FK05_9ASCO|nr:Maintenance of telomere capping protein 1 [Wickerhamiella sorbophila]PRT55321.1 Maintenance of telomere capping protein 1 [Wickerhamiella sorbophila]
MLAQAADIRHTPTHTPASIMSGEDDVLQLLDSIDRERTKKQRARKPIKPREKRADADVMEFLDEVSKSSTPTPPVLTEGTQTSEQLLVQSVKPKPPKAQVSMEEETVKVTTSDSPRSETTAATSDPITSISSWWSRNKDGLWDQAANAATVAKSHATDVVKQAEAKVSEMQKDQGTSAFAFSSWQKSISSVLQTIVPPIGRHEQLKINIFHDMVGYQNIDSLVHEVFARVMDQVEGGGDLNMVVQKGKERHLAQEANDHTLKLNAFVGSYENGKKLAKANIEELISSQTSSPNPEGENFIQHSELFVSIQPVISDQIHDTDLTLQNGGFYFIIYLADHHHKIELTTASQNFPSRWAEILDASAATGPETTSDTKEWILEWVESGLQLAVGVVAQKYVFMRMGLDPSK